MPTSTLAGGTMRPKRMLKPWANMSSWPGRRLGAIVGVVDGLLDRVREGQHDDVGGLDGLGHVHDPQAGALGHGPALGAGGEAHDDAARRSRGG